MADERTRSMGRTAEDEATYAEQLGTTYFLGIGINIYQEFPALNNAVRDIEQVSQLLSNKYSVDQVIHLFNEQAHREAIIATFDELVKKLDEDDRLLVYYSGHGHYNTDTRRGYWIPHDAERDNTANYIRNSTIRDYMTDIKARHILLISDSCFSGSLLVQGGMRSTSHITELEAKASRWVFCSGRHDEEVHDGPRGGHSPFTHHILATLRANESPRLHIARLADEVQELTRSDYQQLPEGAPMYGTHRHKGGQYVFRLRGVAAAPAKSANWSQLDPAIAGVSSGTDLSHPAPSPDRRTLPRWFGWLVLTWIGGIAFIALLDLLRLDTLNQILEDIIFPLFVLLGPVVATWRSQVSKKTLLGLQIGSGILFAIFIFIYVNDTSNQLQNPSWLRMTIWYILGGGVIGWLLPKLR